MQCELNVAADQKLALAENNRKTGSCPVLFTWNGERFVCLGDFLGGGGLGYLVAPGVYGQPDRDEAVAIAPDQLRAEQGVYRLSVTEPMDEVAYLDQLTLDVVDRPPGVSATPDERFAPDGPPADRRAARLADGDRAGPRHRPRGPRRDRRPSRTWDRRTVDDFRRLDGWIGYAEEHGIVLDFGDRLCRFGPDDRLVLCLAGWVEYPYSQTNYAAATAGVALQPPAIERRRDDGTWEVIEPHAGYPAGLPADDDPRPDRQARPARGACSGSGPTWNATGTRRSSPSATARPSRRSASRRCRWPGRCSATAATSREVSPDGRPAPDSTTTTTSTPPPGPDVRAS